MPCSGPGLHAHPTAGSANSGGSSRLLHALWLPLTPILVPFAGTWHGSKNRGGVRSFLLLHQRGLWLLPKPTTSSCSYVVANVGLYVSCARSVYSSSFGCACSTYQPRAFAACLEKLHLASAWRFDHLGVWQRKAARQ